MKHKPLNYNIDICDIFPIYKKKKKTLFYSEYFIKLYRVKNN